VAKGKGQSDKRAAEISPENQSGHWHCAECNEWTR
jgi:hypothetical protein